ncbi:MAG TPA: gamma-glutamyl-gamma-aminobutyrate hydrolase family protein [Acidimicrobiales bacterium]|jgi:gamma-glutamyl-gamma-aminobutyrate hydrolase PuuD|nr:gamma-glutamyl-gamma-aminobutyrate hydrolase family protein [Acidimicrobiales bacterium]
MTGRPLIGITCGRTADNERALDQLDDRYVAAVTAAGGWPVILPPVPEAPMIERLDGLLVSGGGDVDPANYGEAVSEQCGGIDPVRDTAEIGLVRAALAASVPVLGICRGAQVVTVALGGTLVQHLPDVTDLPHLVPDRRTEIVHQIEIVPDSLLHGIVGVTELGVNSIHHQAAIGLGAGLRATATAPDGTVEAVERPGRPVLAVQWHPECLTRWPEQQALFDWLIAAG